MAMATAPTSASGTSVSVLGSRSKKTSTAGLPVADRLSQIARARAPLRKRDELLVHGPVEAERLQEVLAVVAGGVLRQQEIGGVAGDPGQREDDQRQHDAARLEAPQTNRS